MVDEARWQQARAEHAAAVAAFMAAAREVADDGWERQRPGGKWSPAQIAEHLRLTYSTIRDGLEGGTGFRVRVGPARRLLLRLLVLRKLLRRRVFPRNAPATREIRPGGGPFERQPTLDGLQAEVEAFERALTAQRHERSTRVTHPFFGRLTPLQGLELCALHTAHHRGQLQPPAGDAAASA